MAINSNCKQLVSILRNSYGLHSSNGAFCIPALNRKFHSLSLNKNSQDTSYKINLNGFSKYINLCNESPINLIPVRAANMYKVGPRPNPNTEKRNLWFRVIREKNHKYTIKKLDVIKLSGRDPDTGRLVITSKKGGDKKYYKEIMQHVPAPDKAGEFYEERVIDIVKDDFRTASLALVCHGLTARYRIATTSMKKGDLLKTSGHIPEVAVLPKDGDTYPLGALPVGTRVCCVEMKPKADQKVAIAAGSSVTIKSNTKGKILIELKKVFRRPGVKKEVYAIFDEKCLCTVGRVSNPEHSSQQWASINEKRRAGYAPSSGLWQKKTGRFGLKIKKAKTINYTQKKKFKQVIRYKLTCKYFQPNKEIVPSTLRVSRS